MEKTARSLLLRGIPVIVLISIMLHSTLSVLISGNELITFYFYWPILPSDLARKRAHLSIYYRDKLDFKMSSRFLARRPRPLLRFCLRSGTVTRPRCAQTVTTAVFMEMNRGSLNPLFTRPSHRPSASTTPTPSPTPLYPFWGFHPRTAADFFHFAPRIRPCRFARFILSLRPSAPLPYSTSISFPPTTIFFLLSSSRVRAKSTRAAATAVCPPNYAEFISYGTRHACWRPLPVTFIPAVIYERAVYTVPPPRLPFSRDFVETLFFVRSFCDVSI